MKYSNCVAVSACLVAVLLACGGCSRKGKPELVGAASAADVEGVKELLKSGANVDGARDDGLTPLSAACLHGHKSIVELLLRHGANINGIGERTHTPLIAAAMQGHESIVTKLIEAGADVNMTNDAGFSPLIVAAQFGHLNVLRSLLKNHADLNQKRGPFPAIGFAIAAGQCAVVEELLKNGASVDGIPWEETEDPEMLVLIRKHLKD